MNRRFSALLIFLAAMLLIGVLPAQADDYSNIRIVRLSFVEGTVQYQRSGEGWQSAVMNLPMQQGFVLQTGSGFAEVEFEEGLAIRLAYNSSVDFTELGLVDGRRVTRLTLLQGTAIVTANLSHNDEFSIAAPNLDLNVPRSARFRIDATPSGNWVTVFSGKVDEKSPSASALLGSHQTLHLDTAETISQQVGHSPAPDAFDKWVSQREQILLNAQEQANPYLKEKNYTAGFAELTGYGEWSDIRGYGMGWQPYGVGAAWTPYAAGAWSYMPVTGWNWISSEPWGWLPYHFGGWVDDPDYGWVWIPDDMLDWQPANAYWVAMNNYVGWMPSAPPILAHPTKVAPPTRMSVFILATQGRNGTIKPGGRMPLTQSTITQTSRINAPTGPVISPANSAAAQTSSPSTFAGSAGSTNAPAQSGPASPVRAPNGPAALRSPGVSAGGPRLAAPNSLPPAMQAPRAMPASPMMNSAVSARFNGGSNGGFEASRGFEGSRSAGNATGFAGASASGPTGSVPSSANGSSGAKPGGSGTGTTGSTGSTGSAGGTSGGHK